jgi:uncharacterized membrane protein YfcA
VSTAVTVDGVAISPWTFLALVGAAVSVGFSKTAIGGFGPIAVAIFAAVLPARESTGALLPLLLVGDLMAVAAYRAHADRRILLRLLPSVLAGVLLGTLFVSRVGDDLMRRTIGVLLVTLVAVHLWTRRRKPAGAAAPEHPVPPGPVAEAPVADAPRAPSRGARRPWLTAGYGTLAGFTTMVANAGGPVMSLYLLSAGLSMLGFLGTATMFFFIVNAAKVPFSLGLGLISPASLWLDLLLVPAVLLGGWLGLRVIDRIDERLFERLVLLFTVVSALNLLR